MSGQKQIGPLWFPEEEQHFLQYANRVTDYQRSQRTMALGHVDDFSLAIDVGAHVGIFSRHFANHFEKVIAFEPIANLRECLVRNVPTNVSIRHEAVTDRMGTEMIWMLSRANSGCSFLCDERVEQHTDIDASNTECIKVDAVTIDSLQLTKLGLLKVDVQGADHLVLKGAVDTLRMCRPVVLVEEKPVGGPDGTTHHIEAMQKILLSCGGKKREKIGADRIWTFS